MLPSPEPSQPTGTSMKSWWPSVATQTQEAETFRVSPACNSHKGAPCLGGYIVWIVTGERSGYERVFPCRCLCHEAAAS